jgi:hypothetical protein
VKSSFLNTRSQTAWAGIDTKKIATKIAKKEVFIIIK